MFPDPIQLKHIIIFIVGIFVFCEYVFYYLVIHQVDWSIFPFIPTTTKNDKIFIKCDNQFFQQFYFTIQCKWPQKVEDPVRALLLADTHLLGPNKGHWFDKLRREWQMYRSFQSAIYLHQPDVVFILGDIFDEGEWVDDEQFHTYLDRFHSLFYTPEHIKVYSAVGNHDVGFHYKWVRCAKYCVCNLHLFYSPNCSCFWCENNTDNIFFMFAIPMFGRVDLIHMFRIDSSEPFVKVKTPWSPSKKRISFLSIRWHCTVMDVISVRRPKKKLSRWENVWTVPFKIMSVPIALAVKINYRFIRVRWYCNIFQCIVRPMKNALNRICRRIWGRVIVNSGRFCRKMRPTCCGRIWSHKLHSAVIHIIIVTFDEGGTMNIR